MDLSSNLFLLSSISSTSTRDLSLNSDDQNQTVRTRKGHWTKDEHCRYVKFMHKYHSELIDSGKNRRTLKIFKLMSKDIGTRTSAQCRSHHQKFNPDPKNKRVSDDVLETPNYRRIHMCLQTEDFMFTPIRLPEPIMEFFPTDTYFFNNTQYERQDIQYELISPQFIRNPRDSMRCLEFNQNQPKQDML